MRVRIRIGPASWGAARLSCFTWCRKRLEAAVHGPDPVVLTVSQIRQRVYEAARPEGAAEGPGAAAGRLFHMAAAAALNPLHPAHWEKVLGGESVGAEELARRIYETSLGPELGRCRAALPGEQALAAWTAVRGFAHWFCGLVESARRREAIRYDPRRETWEGATDLFRAELEVSRQFREPGWRAPVVVAGRADHLLRVDASRWCVVEFKLGPGHAEADAAQACLYHELLAGSPAGGAAAIVRFGGGTPEEILLEGEWVREARPALLRLIAEAAGVAGGAPRAMPEAAPRAEPESIPLHTWPKAARETDREMGRRLLKALSEFGAGARLSGEPLVGPSFVRFFVEPERGVSAAKTMKQGANLQLRLGLSREPAMQLTGGRVAVDVPRPDREAAPFRQLEREIRRGGEASRAVVGIDLMGKASFIDFAAPEHAHVLVAGVAGSGKTEWLRTALASLLVVNTPETLRLVLVDPKRNAFPEMERSPFLLRPGALLYPPQDDVMPVLEELVDEMERRSALFGEARADHLADYNRKAGEPLPRIVLACDEFADLVLASRQQRAAVETAVNRLGQKARAAGIHLMVATQRPSREVISGILKANLPARVALRVTEGLESRIVLDRNGAEKLLGRGDLLFAANHEPVRLQALYLEEEDRRAILAGEGVRRARR